MHMHAPRLGALLLGLTLLAGCHNYYVDIMQQWYPSKGHADSVSAARSPVALPLVANLSHTASAALIDTDLHGADFEATAGSQHAVPLDTLVHFQPNWTGNSSAFSELAYALYAFDLNGQGEFTTLSLIWGHAQEVTCDASLFIADYGSGRWLYVAPCGATGMIPLGDVRPLANPADQLWIGIVVSGSDDCRLDLLHLYPAVPPPDFNNIFFLHHSTGAGLVFAGDMRSAIAQYNADHGTSFELWDHGYAGDGLTGPDGVSTGTDYGPLTDYTDPPDLHNLWTSADADWTALRTTILDNHEVIAFKSCFPASAIPSADELDYRKQIYLEMRDFFDTRPDRLFVVMSTPPLHRLATTDAEADNARAFADWLTSPAYLDGHPNVVCFDLFDALATPAAAETGWNRLRYNYEISHDDSDSHPNTLANQTVGPLFAEFLCEAAAAYTP